MFYMANDMMMSQDLGENAFNMMHGIPIENPTMPMMGMGMGMGLLPGVTGANLGQLPSDTVSLSSQKAKDKNTSKTILKGGVAVVGALIGYRYCKKGFKKLVELFKKSPTPGATSTP